MANGTSKHWAIVCASRVLPKKTSIQNCTTSWNQTWVRLPEPVGPSSRMLLFSSRSSCLLESRRSLPKLVLLVLLTPRRDASSAANGGLKFAPRPSPLIWSKSDGMVFMFCYDDGWGDPPKHLPLWENDWVDESCCMLVSARVGWGRLLWIRL